MSSAAGSLTFLPNLMVPRAPKAGAQLPDLISFAQGISAAMEQFRVLLESQTEAFVSSSAYIADATIVTAHIQDLQVTTIKRQTTNVQSDVARTIAANSSYNIDFTMTANNAILSGCYPQDITSNIWHDTGFGVQFAISSYRSDLALYRFGYANHNTTAAVVVTSYVEYW